MRFLKTLLAAALCLTLLRGMSIFVSPQDVSTWLTPVYPLQSGYYKVKDASVALFQLQREDDHYRFRMGNEKTGQYLSFYAIPNDTMLVVQMTDPAKPDAFGLLFIETTDDNQLTLYKLPTDDTLPPLLKKLLLHGSNSSEYQLAGSKREIAYFLQAITKPGYLIEEATFEKVP